MANPFAPDAIRLAGELLKQIWELIYGKETGQILASLSGRGLHHKPVHRVHLYHRYAAGIGLAEASERVAIADAVAEKVSGRRGRPSEENSDNCRTLPEGGAIIPKILGN